MPRAFLVRTKSTAVSSEASHQGVEKGNKQGKYLVVIFQSGFLCYELHIFSQLLSGTRRRTLRIKDSNFHLASERIMYLTAKYASNSRLLRESLR